MEMMARCDGASVDDGDEGVNRTGVEMMEMWQ